MKMPGPLVIVLLIAQGVTGVALAVVANKLTAVIHIEGNHVWHLALVLLLVLVAITFFITRGEYRRVTASAGDRSNSEPLMPKSSASIVPLELFPFMFAFGVTAAIVSVHLTPPGRMAFLAWWQNSYEWPVFILGILLLAVQSRLRHYRSILALLYGAVGYSLGVSSMMVFLRPQENPANFTITGWFAAMVVPAIIVRATFVQRILIVFEETIRDAYREPR